MYLIVMPGEGGPDRPITPVVGKPIAQWAEAEQVILGMIDELPAAEKARATRLWKMRRGRTDDLTVAMLGDRMVGTITFAVLDLDEHDGDPAAAAMWRMRDLAEDLDVDFEYVLRPPDRDC